MVAWDEAPAHVGEVVAVEGEVADARAEDGALVLRFSSESPEAFRVVLVVPLFSDLPRHPERLYLGRRIRATGTVRRFGGRTEMLLRSPDAIEVIGTAAVPPAAAEAPPPAATRPPAPLPAVPAPGRPAGPEATQPAPRTPVEATAPAPARAPAAPEPAAPASPAGAAAPAGGGAPAADDGIAPEEPPAGPFGHVDPCRRARERWTKASDEARLRLADLDACLARGQAGCRGAAAALAPALSALEWAEQAVEEGCR